MKEILPFATLWMNLEEIMLSEESQTEKYSYCMVLLLFRIFFLKSIYFGCAESSLLCRFFSSCGERGLLFIAVCRLLVVASLVAEHELWGMRASVVVAPKLWSTVSIVVAPKFSCSATYGTFPDQGLNLCLLHWQADSLPLSQGSLRIILKFKKSNSLTAE